MLVFETQLLRYEKMGEKTVWTYILVAEQMALKLKPNNRKAFRVKGTIDQFVIQQVAIIPIGEGDFIMAINSKMRKGIARNIGDFVSVCLEIDDSPLKMSEDLLDCLEQEPAAINYFNTLAISHRKYFSNWIEEAKTIETKTKRITKAIWALSNKMGYPEMLRYFKALKDNNLQ